MKHLRKQIAGYLLTLAILLMAGILYSLEVGKTVLGIWRQHDCAFPGCGTGIIHSGAVRGTESAV